MRTEKLRSLKNAPVLMISRLLPRIWRIHATITMPKFTRMEADGSFPRVCSTFNLYSEQRLFNHGDIEIWIKCKEPVTHDSGRYSSVQSNVPPDPSNCPYFLESRVSSEESHENAINRVISPMETITDFLTFQLNYPVKIIQMEAASPKPNATNEFDVWMYSGPPYPRIVKDAVAVFMEPVATTFDDSQMRFQIDEEVLAALRWFAKGVAGNAVIDKFTFYWIAFESLAMKWPNIGNEQRYLRCPRCQEAIHTCPLCGEETGTGLLIGDRIRYVACNVLGRDAQLIDNLYETRHLVHGTMRLRDPREIEKLPSLTQQMKALALDGLKVRLGITATSPPVFDTGGGIMWGSYCLQVQSRDLAWP